MIFKKTLTSKTGLFLLGTSVLIALGAMAFASPRVRAYADKQTERIWTKLYTWDLAEEIEANRADMQRFYNNSTRTGAEALIAHGGGVGEFTYTNSLEAVQDSLNRGFQFIELDLQKTVDGHIVAIHEWPQFAQMTGKSTEEVQKMPLSELKKLKIHGKYTVLGGDDIRRLMEQHPQFILVTDKLQDFALMLKEIPFPERMIVECFGRVNYKKALRAGIKYPAFSAWKDTGEIEQFRFPLVVMSAYAMEDEQNAEKVRKLHEDGTTILMFWASICDEPEFIKQHLSSSISKIYTDTWSPAL